MASKVIIVTGASRGIGFHAAQSLLKSSHRVVLTARSDGPLADLQKSYPDQVAYVAGDMADFSMADKLRDLALSTYGCLDGIIINHGGLSPMTRLENSSVADWKQLYDINVFSGLALVKSTIPALRSSKGCVVWISSGAATHCYVSWGAYGSSKTAANSLSGHLAAEEPDITSIAVSPGRVNTDMQRVLRELGTEMDASERQSFVDAFEKGEMIGPEVPGDALARLVVAPKKELSGKFLSLLKAPELATYVSK